MSRCHSIGPGDLEEARPTAPVEPAAALDNLRSPHHPPSTIAASVSPAGARGRLAATGRVLGTR